MKSPSVLATLLLVACASGNVTAAASDELSQLRDLFRSGNSEAAYELALQMLDRFEGDHEFDFLFGASAVDTDHNSLGVFALERAHAVQPENNLIKLELARGLFKLGIHDRAVELFDEVLETDPPLAVRQRIEGYKQIIGRVTAKPDYSLSGYAELGAGYDSNVNSGPDSQPTLVSLSSTAMESDDLFTQQRVGAGFSYRYEPGRALSANIGLAARQYPDYSNQNYTQASVSLMHDWTQRDSSYTLGLNLENYQLNGNSYRKLAGAFGRWDKILDESTRIRTTVSWYQLKFSDLGYRDADQVMLDTTYFRSASTELTPIWYAGLFVGHTSPDRPSPLSLAEVKRDFIGVNLGVRLNLADQFWVTPGITYQHQQFAGQSWLYGAKRQDRFYGPTLKAEWRINPKLTLGIDASSLRNDSNFDLYNFDRTQLMLSARLNF